MKERKEQQLQKFTFLTFSFSYYRLRVVDIVFVVQN